MKRRQEFAKRLKILGKKDGEAIVQRGVEKAERIIEETEDDEIKTALNVLNEYIINHIKKLPAQEQKKAIDELIDKILNSDNIEHNEEIAIGVINNMLKEKEVPNKYVIDSAKELDDSTLTKLNEEDEIPISERRELIKAIDDDEKRKEQLEKLKKEEEKRKKKIIQKERKILQKVYSECGKETPDNELVMKVETAISKTPHLSKEEMEQMKAKILAKQIAYNYKMFGSVKLKLLSEIMSAKEMKQIGIIDLVEEESIKLSNGKEKEFNEKRDLERRLNKEIQEEYAKYNEKDEMEKVINMLKAFPKEDRIKIIEEIKDFVSNKTKQLNAKKVDEEER